MIELSESSYLFACLAHVGICHQIMLIMIACAYIYTAAFERMQVINIGVGTPKNICAPYDFQSIQPILRGVAIVYHIHALAIKGIHPVILAGCGKVLGC